MKNNYRIDKDLLFERGDTSVVLIYIKKNNDRMFYFCKNNYRKKY